MFKRSVSSRRIVIGSAQFETGLCRAPYPRLRYKIPVIIEYSRHFSGNSHNAFETTVKFKPAHVFRVVADVESYSKFVPWCTKSRIVEEISPRERLADLTVGFTGISEETFRSRVILDPYRSVTAIASSELYSKSPLKRLKNIWTFEPVGDDETHVSMELEFEFHNPFYTRITSHFLKRISNLAMSSFVARCDIVKPVSDEDIAISTDDNPAQAKLENPPMDHSFRGVQDSFKSLASCAHFQEYEVEVLAHEFQRLTSGTAGKLHKQGLAKWLRCDDNRVIWRLFLAMDMDRNGALTLREFIRGISLISRGTAQEKKFAWFGSIEDEDIPKEELELVVVCTLRVRDALNQTMSPSPTISPYERPDAAAARLVAPIYRSGTVNTRALERLFATL